jgi:hypothetical protein
MVAAGLCVDAQGCPLLPAADTASATRAAQSLDAAIHAGNAGSLQQLVAPSFTQVLGDGQRVDREGYIRALSRPLGVAYRTASLSVCGWGDTAIVTFDAEFDAPRPSLPPVRAFIVNVWQRSTSPASSAGWQLAFEQIGVRP